MVNGRFFTYLGLYVVLGIATVPLILGWVPPNRWYGFRLPGARISPEIWYEINSLGGKLFLSALFVCCAVNLLVFWKGNETMVKMAGWINAGLILLSFWLVSLELVQHLPR